MYSKLKTVLVPTDFSVESLLQIKYGVIENSSSHFRIVLVHGFFLSDSIAEMLFYSPQKKLEECVSDEFRTACEILINKYSTSVFEIKIELFHGYTQKIFNHFLEAQNIEMIFIPGKYKLKKQKNSIDLIPLIKKSGLSLKEINWDSKSDLTDKNQLAELFID